MEGATSHKVIILQSIEIANMPPTAAPNRRASRRIAGSSRPVAGAPNQPISAKTVIVAIPAQTPSGLACQAEGN
jgi:hypothetical protein